MTPLRTNSDSDRIWARRTRCDTDVAVECRGSAMGGVVSAELFMEFPPHFYRLFIVWRRKTPKHGDSLLGETNKELLLGAGLDRFAFVERTDAERAAARAVQMGPQGER